MNTALQKSVQDKCISQCMDSMRATGTDVPPILRDSLRLDALACDKEIAEGCFRLSRSGKRDQNY